jgi:cell wall-associated NlpC family hydrolase
MAKHRKTPQRALRKRAARSLSVVALVSALSTGPMPVLNSGAVPALAASVSTTAPIRVAGPVNATLASVTKRHRPGINARLISEAKRFIGVPYVYGGESPYGFDCSGLTQYVYRKLGKHIPRTADDQFRHFRMISHHDAREGDLVFFHETSDPWSYVYHVGILTGNGYMIAAPSTGYDVQVQSFSWGGDTVTFGTVTHA